MSSHSSQTIKIFIVAAKRTPLGTYGGRLTNKSATDLAEHAGRAAIKAAGIAPEHVDSVVMGNVMQTSADAAYIARHVGLRCGLKQETPALTINRLCGSGFQALVNAAHEILLGESRVVLAGGTESMSQAPYVVRDIRFGTTLGKPIEFEDVLWAGLTDRHVKMPMAMTAEKLGAQYKITRADVDEFALKSQTRWRLANNAGYFNNEIEPMTFKSKKGETVFSADEHPRETTAETLAKLPSLFQKDGLVTAGTASGVADGAAALVLASEDAVKDYKLTPLARLVAWNVVGCDPTIMGIGPAPAIAGLLKKTGKTIDEIDLVEVNEAFAAQALAVERAAKLNPDKTNVNGGAIAIGHPLGASGARITTHLVHELHRRGDKWGIGSACIGGGQGIAIMVENIQ